jgi:AcrR family transcriptional regulator
MEELDTAPRTLNREHRRRLLEGMARALAAKGYADTTIGDIVREAAVSRRTFYEHFHAKAQCLIALYEASSHNALQVLQEAIDPSHDWESQVEQALSAYLQCMAQSPMLLRTLFVEILHLGAEGLQSRRRVNGEIADFILKVVNSDADVRGTTLTSWEAMALVGGIHELVLHYIEQDKVAELADLVAPASQLIRAVTHTDREAVTS